MKRFISLLLLISLFSCAGILCAEEPPVGSSAETSITSAPPKIDTGDTAWMIVATAFVMLMTLPGLALFYGGLAKRKDSLNTMAMSFVTYCIVSFLWVLYGFSFTFGTDIGGIIGSAEKLLLSGVGTNSINDLAKTIPEYVYVVYQMTFAAITVALASGAYIERMKFSAWVLFSILWMTLVYVPVAHWVWGGGFLAKLGALDFAGGTVVHVNAGVAALVAAVVVGKRRDFKSAALLPHNVPFTLLGAGRVHDDHPPPRRHARRLDAARLRPQREADRGRRRDRHRGGTGRHHPG